MLSFYFGGKKGSRFSYFTTFSIMQSAVVSLLTAGGRIREKSVAERSPSLMEEMQIATIGSFCMNETCEDYKKVDHGNMIKSGKTDTGVQRYLCKTCKKSF